MITATESLPEVESSRTDSSPSAENPLRAPSEAETPKTVWHGADLLLLGLTAVLTVAAFVTARGQFRQWQARNRVIQDLAVAAAAFQSYMIQNGSAPADAGVGILPKGMAPFLTGLNWTAPTPVGGHYRWINASPPTAPAITASTDRSTAVVTKITAPIGGMIALTAFPASPALNLSPADLLAIDRDLDDGNLTTGKFRLGFNGWPVLTVRARP